MSPGLELLKTRQRDMMMMNSGGIADKKILEDLMAMIENTISPLERLLRTKPLWFLPEVAREAATKLLHNKSAGNFIIRGSRQPDTLAITVKIGTTGTDEVQHFIIQKTDRKVCLEDSDIKFDNLVSLAFHYSHTCEELPEQLCLPTVLREASLQSLASLSLLGKSFWTCPLATSGRTSLFLKDNNHFSSLPSQLYNQDPVCGNYSGPSDQQSNKNQNTENVKMLKTPPIASRKLSLGTNSPPPAAAVKYRRKSDSASFSTGVSGNMSGGGKTDHEGWVSSPMFPVSTPNSRHRKVSVFDGKLVSVNEILEDDHVDNEVMYEDISEQRLSPGYANSNSLHNEAEDYAVPVDAVNEDAEHNIYDNPIYPSNHPDIPSNAPGKDISIRTHRLSDTSIRYGVDMDSDNLLRSSLENPVFSKRKLSLGIILRKISSGSLQGNTRKTSLQERRLSNAFTKLITLPTFLKNTLGEGYQVDSSSWEFLNKDTDVHSWDENEKRDKRNLKKDIKHTSKDSVYESEYDSSSTMDSSSSSKRSVSSSNMFSI